MFKILRPINRLRIALLIPLGFGLASHAIAQAASAAENGQRPAPDHTTAAVHNHRVKLSWLASVPASKLPRDAVIGYNLYRSTTSHDPNPRRINSAPCKGTTYTDPVVAPGTYFYVTRGVTTKGVESASSNEVKVVVPSP